MFLVGFLFIHSLPLLLPPLFFFPDSASDVVMQFSSIGSLGKNPVSPNSWMIRELASSLRTSGTTLGRTPSLRIIYPTTETVRFSIEGWRGGGALPHGVKLVLGRNFCFSSIHLLLTQVQRQSCCAT